MLLLLPLLLQVRGKGHWGKWEGMENIFKLRRAAGAFVQNPLNYDRVQAVLNALPSTDAVMVKDTNKWHNTGFSGAAQGRLAAWLAGMTLECAVTCNAVLAQKQQRCFYIEGS